jgi:putative ABC transport system ATP-binding protein
LRRDLSCELLGWWPNGEAVMDLLTELHKGGATICMVTHDPRYTRYADRSIDLFDGRIQPN